MRFQHAALGVSFSLPDPDQLTQRHVDLFIVEYNKQPPATDATKTVKSAFLAGWIRDTPMSADMVDNLSPRVVRWMALKIDALYTEAITIPPE